MPQPRPGRPGRVCARALLLVVLGLSPAAPARAATDQLVVDEYLLRCSDGSAGGAFVELNANGPGQTFDASVGLELLGPTGNLLVDMPGILAARAGQAWPQGMRFLIAAPEFAALTGVTPDTLLAGTPTTPGSIVLYRRLTATSIAVIERVDYSSSSPLQRQPPTGRSAVRTADGRHLVSPEASPTTSDGTLARAPGCFASALRPIVVQEVATSCAGGDPGGSFVELATTSTNQFMDGDLALRARDHAGAVLFDLPLGFGSLEGSAWPLGRTWLAGSATLRDVFGNGPDLVWPAPLDTTGGTVTLHGVDATGAEVVLSELTYGTAGQPAPLPGGSLVWSAFNLRYQATSPATPVGNNSHPYLPQGCAPPSSVRIRELLTACSILPQTGSYVELIALDSNERRDSTLSLAAYDSANRLQGEVPLGFGALAGSPWPLSTSWLLSTPELSNAIHSLPDAPLPFTLDLLAGRLELRRLDPATGAVRELVQVVRWGGGDPAPTPGQALTRVSDASYRVTAVPQPRTSGGFVLACPPPPDTLISTPTWSIEICLACFDGSRRGQFVQLNLLNGVLLDSSFVLRLYDHTHALIGTLPRIFAPSVGQHASASHGTWLVGDPEYGSFGASTDATLPVPLDPLGGTVEVVWSRGGIERAGFAVSYGQPGTATIPPGYSEQFPAGVPSPQFPRARAFSGVSQILPGCHFTDASAYGKPYVSEIFPACADSSASLEYVLIGGIDARLTPDPRIGLRMLDPNGRLIEGIFPLFPTSIPTGDSSLTRTLLLAGPGFAARTGLAPDRVLQVPLDPRAGSIELTITDPAIGGTLPFNVASYTVGSLPQYGRALVFVPGAQTFTRRGPIARRLDGQSAVFPPECADASSVVPMRLGQLTFGCFDGDPRGQYVKLVSSGLDDSLTAEYALVVRDHAGATLADLQPAFGVRRGLPTALAQALLIATPGSTMPVAVDALLPAQLDTRGGSLTLVQRTAVGERLVWAHRYSREAPGAMPMGWAFAPASDSTWGLRTPSIENWGHTTGSLAGCLLGGATLPQVVLKGVAGACGDGTTGDSYIELTAAQPIKQLAGLTLRLFDADGITDLPLFPDAHAFDSWPAGRSLLAASDSFGVLTGIHPDRRLPRGFGSVPASISLLLAEPGAPSTRPITSYAFSFVDRPEPGRALERTPQNDYAATSHPTPSTWDGVVHTLPAECFTQSGLPDAVRLSRVLLECASGATGSQFVQVDRTSGLATRTSDLKLRVLDRDGVLRGEVAQLFGTSTQTFWGATNSLAIGGPEFESAYQLVPDAALPAVLDTLGGTLQLVRPGPSGDRILSELRYGPGGVARPPGGMALAWNGSTWAVDSLPVPIGFAGTGQASASCGARCDVQSYQLGLGGSQISTAESGEFSELDSDIRFDMPRAEVAVSSSFRRVQMLTGDGYSLVGALPGDTLGVTLHVTESHLDTCIAHGCLSSTRRLVLLVNGSVIDSLAADARGTVEMRARIPFEPNGLTRIQLLAAAEGRLTPPLPASVDARLSFDRPRAGTRLVSCHGYDSEKARVVLDPVFQADAHRVAITWPVYAAPGFTAVVERFDESEAAPAWVPLETRPLEPDGYVRFVDLRVVTEHSYRYRLAWSDLDGPRESDELRVQVPRSFGFALLGVRPNPSHGTLAVAFELPEASDTRIELFDVVGRRVRDVQSRFEAGPQLVALAGGRLSPGLYTVRLRAQGREARRTAVVVP